MATADAAAMYPVYIHRNLLLDKADAEVFLMFSPAQQQLIRVWCERAWSNGYRAMMASRPYTEDMGR